MVVGAALVLGMLFFELVMRAHGFGINLLLVQIVFVGAVCGLSRHLGHKVPHEGWMAAGFSLAFAAAFAIWSSPLSLVVAFFGLVVSQVVFVLYTVGHHMEFHHPLTFVFSAFLSVPLRALSRIHIFSHVPRPKIVPARLLSIGIGLCVLVPILIVFGLLFGSADPLYAEYLGRVFDLETVPTGLQHIVGILFWSLVFGCVLALAFWKRETFKDSFRPEAKWHTESIVILGGVILLFASFVMLQVSYLFGGEIAFQATNYTFSEYARRGFHELVVVATIVLFLFLSLRYLHGDRGSKTLLTLHSILFLETFLVLVSAVMRMNLYVDAYGYTEARLFTYWFLAAVAVLLVLAFVHLFRDEPQPRFLRQGLVIVGVFALGFIVSTPGALAIRLNVERIVREGQMDVSDVLTASPEAYSTLVYLYDQGVTLSEPSLGSDRSVRRQLSSFYESGDWRTWSWFRRNPEESFPWFGCVTKECDAAVK